MKSKNLTWSLLFLVIATFVSYSDDNTLKMPVASNYSDMSNWLAMPAYTSKEVDVFFLYPTTYHPTNETEPDICAITHKSMRLGAQGCLLSQASAFETVGNIYAPYYRQSSIRYIEKYTYTQLMTDILPAAESTADVLAAFDYYIKNKNNGRPFILAGHSQGSMELLFVLSKYMSEHPDVYTRMIAAYVIGYGVTNDYLSKNPHLKFAESNNDTKVIISYNTEGEVVEGVSPVAPTGSISINPLSWTRSTTPAPASLNVGTCKAVNGTMVDNIGFADAKISSRGTIICSTVDPNDYQLPLAVFPKGVYHGADYEFYYYNLRKNAQDRVNAYLRK